MLHLARIQRKAFLGRAELHLLARQRSEYNWDIVADHETIIAADVGPLNEGAWILVDISDSNQIDNIREATEWVLDMIEQYLTLGMTPAHLQEEMERAEQWRQSLTLQNQEVARRALETEARRDQIQELEENLKQEKENLSQERQQLEQKAIEIEARSAQVQQQEAELQQARTQLEQIEMKLKEQYQNLDENGEA